MLLRCGHPRDSRQAEADAGAGAAFLAAVCLNAMQHCYELPKVMGTSFSWSSHGPCGWWLCGLLCQAGMHRRVPGTLYAAQVRMLELEAQVRRTEACCPGEGSFGRCLLGSLHSISREGTSQAWRDAAAQVLGMLCGQQ